MYVCVCVVLKGGASILLSDRPPMGGGEKVGGLSASDLHEIKL